MNSLNDRVEEPIDDSLNILVVEDDDGLRRLIQKRLERKRFKVMAVETGQEAISCLTANPSALLLLDYRLPDMNGRELIENLSRQGTAIPFVVITGHGDERTAVEMMKLGARDYLVKDQSLLEVLPRVMEQICSQVSTETKLSMVKKALQESEERFKMLFNSGTDAIFDPQIKHGGDPGNFFEVNDIACKRLGYSRPQLLRMSMKNIEIPASIPAKEDFYRGENSEGLHHRLYEAIQVTSLGERIHVENNSHLIDLDGKPAILCISRDITQRKELEEQLRQAQKMEAIGKLAGGVAHDFNNLLTAIMGYSELMMMKMNPDNAFRENVEEINRAGKRAAALTQQLLAFSRKQVLKPKILQLNQVVKNMEKMLERIIGENIRFFSELSPQLDKIKADASQLEQIILNLTVNAVDAMPKGGTLTIKTENTIIDNAAFPKTLSLSPQPGHYICLSISDSGEGIDNKIISQIFEPFFTTKTDGTGLGLSVVYGIVKQHNGWIDVDSEPGRGSNFKIYFPALSSDEAISVEKEVVLTEMGGKGEKVLLVEDEKGVRDISIKVLRNYGYKVIDAVTAQEATEIFEREKRNFHLVVSDIVLPDKSGIELTDELRSRQPGLKTLLTSGYVDQRAHWGEAVKRDIPFLQKPYSLVDLLKTVKDVLNIGYLETPGPKGAGK